MARTISSERVGFSLEAESRRVETATPGERPFRIAVLGDFSGRGGADGSEPAPALNMKARLVDRDNVEDVLGEFGARLRLALGDDLAAELEFRSLDDFHPDHLYRTQPVFQAIRSMRERLLDPASFGAAAAELMGSAPEAAEAAPLPPAPVDLLEQMLGEAGHAGPAKPARKRDAFSEFLSRVTAPYLEPGRDPREEELVKQIDAAATRQMRAILHHPAFQALESLWRGVYWLARGLETGGDLKLLLINATKAEMAADLLADVDTESTAVYKALVEKTVGTPGAETWAVLAGHYAFGPETDDLVFLGRMAAVARAAGAPWIAAADPRLAGCSSFAATPDVDDWDKAGNGGWQALRELGGVNFVGLAAPRFLLRPPYGKDTEACERFAFEEIENPGNFDGYLWGNPALACAFLLGKTFEERGWALRPGEVREIDGLPLYIYKEDGESVSLPCAEMWMTERAASRMLERGLMPLASIKNDGAATLVRFQSIAHPPAPLSGGWE